MLLRQMKYFVTIVDCNSFTEAADLGEDTEKEMQLKIGYVSCYSGQELHRAVAEFAGILHGMLNSLLTA